MNNKRNFKDSVFTMLFSDPDDLRELYCALGGVTLSTDIPVSINTLENVLYMDFNNDISFEIGGKLVVLIEHQSTINPNMALRLLFYITRVLEKRIESEKIYSSKRLSVPWPEFFVLYNGTDPFPDEEIMRLSDLFERPGDLGLPEKAKPLLELEVKVININEGRNEAVVKQCQKLAEYAAFIAKIRYFYYKEKKDLKKSIEKAVKYCQEHSIMNKFLEIHASEILNMLTAEWNMDEAIAYVRKEAWEDGREDGLQEGWEKGRVEIAQTALAEGLSAETIRNITGLDLDVIQGLQAKN